MKLYRAEIWYRNVKIQTIAIIEPSYKRSVWMERLRGRGQNGHPSYDVRSNYDGGHDQKSIASYTLVLDYVIILLCVEYVLYFIFDGVLP